MRLHALVPVVTFIGLVYLRIPLPLLIPAGAGCRDAGGIDDRALLRRYPVGLEVLLHGCKNLLAQIVLLQQMPERQARGLIRDPVGGDQGDAGKTAHRCHLDQRILHRCIAQVVPLLLQVDLQYGLQEAGRLAGLAAGIWVVD